MASALWIYEYDYSLEYEMKRAIFNVFLTYILDKNK